MEIDVARSGRTQSFPPCDRRGPVFNANRIKLGIFGLNVSSSAGITAAKDRHEIDWVQNLRLVQEAERAGFEAAVPVARWRGFEGASNPWGNSFETYTWAAGLAARTSRIGIFCTSHALTTSPVSAAKQMSTIDHISNGRAVLNVVAGWFQKELDMFAVGDLDHDARYRYLAEWMEVLLRLWTRDETFDFEGDHIKVKGGYQQPKSIQSPRPPVMNAALSPVGHAFAAQWADIAFINPDSTEVESVRAKVDALRGLAAERGREVQIWAPARVWHGATAGDAQDEIAHYFDEEGDPAAQANSIDWVMGGAKLPPAIRKSMIEDCGRSAGCNLIGTAEEIAGQVGRLSEAGIDGLCLQWMNFERGLPRFVAEVLPLLERAGLRAPAAPI